MTKLGSGRNSPVPIEEAGRGMSGDLPESRARGISRSRHLGKACGAHRSRSMDSSDGAKRQGRVRGGEVGEGPGSGGVALMWFRFLGIASLL